MDPDCLTIVSYNPCGISEHTHLCRIFFSDLDFTIHGILIIIPNYSWGSISYILNFPLLTIVNAIGRGVVY